MKLLIGLGNPGDAYESTRHNLGWDALRAFAEAHEGSQPSSQPEWKAAVSSVMVEGERVVCVWPLTFMNLSGDAVQAMAHFYKVPKENILVIHDEMDFPLGELAFTGEAGPAGHNGVASIQERFKTEAIPRLRLGIGRPQAPIKKEDHVLQRFSKDEMKTVEDVLGRAVSAIHDWLTQGLEKSMNRWN